MTTIKRHIELLKFSLQMIDDTLARGLASNPRAIAFAASSGAADLLSIYLHKLGKLPIGKVIEHQWFKKPQQGQKKEPILEEKLGVDFPRKKQVYDIMCDIEEKRGLLAYGNPTDTDVEAMLGEFRKLKTLVEEEIGDVEK